MLEELAKTFRGDIKKDTKTRRRYSHDTSLFEVKPQAVAFPRDSADVKALVKFVNDHKGEQADLSLTARSGGTDMTGGAINESIIVEFDRYMNHIGAVSDSRITAEPGAYYRDFDKVTKAAGQLLPSYPASRSICAIGGMVANNAGGEKSLTYGKTEDYVRRLKVVLADGQEYEVKPLNEEELAAKTKQDDFEGGVYKSVKELIKANSQVIAAAKPKVSKNSTGYKIWDVWDQQRGVFDLTQLFVGSQGTLGLVTEVEFGLVKAEPRAGLLIGYLSSLDDLSDIIRVVLKHRPTSFEAFDDYTFRFALRFFWRFHKTLGWWGLVKLAVSFIPDALILLRRGIPKMLMLVEFEGDTRQEVKTKLEKLDAELEKFDIELEEAASRRQANRFWLMRRESFNLLRKNVKGKHTAPFIDDLIVPPESLEEFLPRLRAIVDKYELLATIAGHLGDGNFHVIPLMDLREADERAKIEPVLREVIALVKEYGGSISAEHNDGLIRSPFLKEMYGEQIVGIFEEVKQIFDPEGIFNPHKKTDAEWEYSKAHIRQRF